MCWGDRYYYQRWYSGGRFGVQDPIRGTVFCKFERTSAYCVFVVVTSVGGYDEAGKELKPVSV